MTLTDTHRSLLRLLLTEEAKNSDGVNALRFRVKHEEGRTYLDELERLRVIEKKDNKYRLKLLGLSVLRSLDPEANHIVAQCERLFDALRDIYRKDQERQVTINELAVYADLSDAQALRALDYISELPIWRGRASDLRAKDAYVIPSEGILDYKTFGDLLAELARWSSPAALPTSTREKQQKFRILDSPDLLKSDLERPSGALGSALLYIDLDDFKNANTLLTEVVVDELVLPPIHRFLDASVDRLGYAYAEGGDEFIVYLPNATVEVALSFAEVIRRGIENLSFQSAAAKLRFTASIGVAHAAATADGSQLRYHANLAKKHAKDVRKNCVAVWNDHKASVVEQAQSSTTTSPVLEASEDSFSALRERATNAYRKLEDEVAKQKTMQAMVDRYLQLIDRHVDLLKAQLGFLEKTFDLTLGDAGMVVSTPGVDDALLFKGREVCIQARHPAEVRLHSGIAVVATTKSTFILVARHVIENDGDGPRRAYCLWEGRHTVAFRSDLGEKYLEELAAELLASTQLALEKLVSELEARARRVSS